MNQIKKESFLWHRWYGLLEPGPVVLVTTAARDGRNHVKGRRLTWQTSCPVVAYGDGVCAAAAWAA